MGPRKLPNDLEIGHAYVSNKDKFVFLITGIDKAGIRFHSFNYSDGSYDTLKIWSDAYFMDRIYREATSGEMAGLDLQAAKDGEKSLVADWERREQLTMSQISPLTLILEVQKQNLIPDILENFVTIEDLEEVARRKGFILMKKED